MSVSVKVPVIVDDGDKFDNLLQLEEWSIMGELYKQTQET